MQSSIMSNVKTGELLSFHDFSPEQGDNDGSARIDVEAVHNNKYSTNVTNPNYNFGDDIKSNEEPVPTPSNHNFWTIEYYQKYFDVQTNEVVERIISSVVPQKVSWTYFNEQIRGKPDLYGPIWISITLIFTIAVSGNIANYLQNMDNSNVHWRYNFHMVSFAATAIFSYVFLIPLALWAVLKWSINEDSQEQVDAQQSSVPSMISLFCLYGYSLSIYIPVAILWTIQVSWLQWLFVLMAALVSGSVLLFWLLPALKKSRYFLIIAGVTLAIHFLLATGFMMYFFHGTVAHTVAPIKNVTATGLT